MSEVLSWAQPFIQLEETIKSSANYSAKRVDDGEKSKSQYESTSEALELGATSSQETDAPNSSTEFALSLQADRALHLLMHGVFNAIKAQPRLGARD